MTEEKDQRLPHPFLGTGEAYARLRALPVLSLVEVKPVFTLYGERQILFCFPAGKLHLLWAYGPGATPPTPMFYRSDPALLLSKPSALLVSELVAPTEAGPPTLENEKVQEALTAMGRIYGAHFGEEPQWDTTPKGPLCNMPSEGLPFFIDVTALVGIIVQQTLKLLDAGLRLNPHQAPTPTEAETICRPDASRAKMMTQVSRHLRDYIMSHFGPPGEQTDGRAQFFQALFNSMIMDFTNYGKFLRKQRMASGYAEQIQVLVEEAEEAPITHREA